MFHCLRIIILPVLLLVMNSLHASAPAESKKLNFVENLGQWDGPFQFKVDLKGGWMFLEKSGMTFLFSESIQHAHGNNEEAMAKQHDHSIVDMHAYRVKWLGGNEDAVIISKDKNSFVHNYFLGSDTSKWKSDVAVWNEVEYQELYQHIDYRVYSKGNMLKSDYIVRTGGNPAQIRLQYVGVGDIYINDDGGLMIKTSVNEILESKPYVYQVMDGIRVEIASEYVLENGVVSFVFPDGYDENYDLIIDPELIFSTYTSSASDSWGASATNDSEGNMYLGGIAFGGLYPTTTGAFQADFAGGSSPMSCDVVITKYTTDGVSKIYSTYIGGRSNEILSSLYSTNEDELIALMTTGSDNFPVHPNGYRTTFSGGTNASAMFGSIGFPRGTDVAIVKFSKDGTRLVGGTYFGGTANDGLNTSSLLRFNYGDESRGDITVDEQGNIYFVSNTFSTNIPGTTGSFQPNRGGSEDGLIVKLNKDLSGLIWSSYYGGSAADAIYSIQLDKANNVFVTGGTRSSDIPGTANGLNKAFMGGPVDGFIAKLTPDGKSVLSATYIGTAFYDQSHIMDLDVYGNVYVFGQTLGVYPVTSGVYSTRNGRQFIHKLNNNLDSTYFSTVFGAMDSINISPTAFMVDVCGNIYAVGWGGESNYNPNYFLGHTFGMPVTADAFMTETDGSDFYMINLSKDAESLLYATYIGEIGSDDHVDGGTSRFDRGGVVYQAICASCGGSNSFPVTPDANGQNNLSDNCNIAGIKFRFDLTSLQLIRLKADPETGCNSLATRFTYEATVPGTEFFWSFGDGNVSNEQYPTHTYSTPGTYRVKMILSDSTNCNPVDSAFMNVNVYHTTIETKNVDLCVGEFIEIAGERYETSGTYQILLTNQHGCDSLLTLNLTVKPVVEVNIGRAICEGESYNFNGTSISVAGIYYDTISCDSIVILTLNVNNNQDRRITASICEGDTYYFNGRLLSNPGIYLDTMTGVNGCKEFLTLNLLIFSDDTTHISAEICKNAAYNFCGSSISESGTYFCRFPYDITADTIPKQMLNVGAPVVAAEYPTAYGANSPALYSQYNTDGTALADATSPTGYTLEHLTHPFWTGYGEVDKRATTLLGRWISGASQFNVWYGASYILEVSETKVYYLAVAADNLFRFSVDEKILMTSSNLNRMSIQNGYTSNPERISFRKLHIYPILLEEGCHVITLEGLNQSQWAMFAGAIFDNTAQELRDAAGFDDLNIIFSTQSTDAFFQNSALECPVGYQETGPSYCDSCVRSASCDSVVALTLSVMDVLYSRTESSICNGQTYVFNGQELTTSGIYLDTLKSAYECDSIVTLELTVFDNYTQQISAQICEDEVYVFGGRQLTVSGIYFDSLSSVTGCDSTIILTLSVGAKSTNEIEATICKGGEYIVGSQTFSESGTYQIDFTSVYGCDSTVNLHLVVADSIIQEISAQICNGEDYLFYGTSYTQPGTYSVQLPGTICDTTVYLNLSHFPEYEIDIQLNENPVEQNQPFDIAIEGDFISEVSWKPGGIFIDSNVLATTGIVAVEQWLYVTVIDTNGCRVNDSVWVEVNYTDCQESHVYVPNAFTPNGDGVNDFLMIRTVYPLEEVVFRIYNRWGEKVFETNDSSIGWDGYYKGNLSESGAYSFYLKTKCKDLLIERKGNITLMR